MERLKNMELKKTFLVLSASCVLVALLMLGLVFMICNSISSNFPSGGIEILADGSIVKMETLLLMGDFCMFFWGVLSPV